MKRLILIVILIILFVRHTDNVSVGVGLTLPLEDLVFEYFQYDDWTKFFERYDISFVDSATYVHTHIDVLYAREIVRDTSYQGVLIFQTEDGHIAKKLRHIRVENIPDDPKYLK